MSTSYYPADPIDLFQLWKRSETEQQGDPKAFWESITSSGPRGCHWCKVTTDETILQPFTLASDPKIL